MRKVKANIFVLFGFSFNIHINTYMYNKTLFYIEKVVTNEQKIVSEKSLIIVFYN